MTPFEQLEIELKELCDDWELVQKLNKAGFEVSLRQLKIYMARGEGPPPRLSLSFDGGPTSFYFEEKRAFVWAKSKLEKRAGDIVCT
jgi:hypothetical protein